VDGPKFPIDCPPFPTSSSAILGTKAGYSLNKRKTGKNFVTREPSGEYHTEYDNAESPDGLKEECPSLEKDSRREKENCSRANHIKRSFQRGKETSEGVKVANVGKSRPSISVAAESHRHSTVINADPGNDADVDSNCSSLTSSMMVLDNARWKSVHSIGYENEYEFDECYDEDENELQLSAYSASYEEGLNENRDDDEPCSTNAASKSIGYYADFLAVDAESGETNEEGEKTWHILDTESEMKKLSKTIRHNFGDFQLSKFSDIDT